MINGVQNFQSNFAPKTSRSKKSTEKVPNLFLKFGAKILKEFMVESAVDIAAKKVIKIVVKHFSFFSAEILVCFG